MCQKNVIAFSIFICLSLFHLSQGAPSKAASKKEDNIYIVVVDAGSSGSRVVGYEFKKEGSKLKLLNEKFNKTAPGLSSYADNPRKGAIEIYRLVRSINSFVPKHLKSKTNIYLRATAGLRLLGDEKAQKLLDAVQNKFTKTKYKVVEKAADMLSGVDEGIYAWFTVNFLKETLDKQTFAALEMGGASAQVTYVPRTTNLQKKLKSDMYPAHYKNLKVFSKSYLGLGINAARHAMFEAEVGNITEGQNVSSSCVSHFWEPISFTFNNQKYTVRGKEGCKKRVNVPKCQEYVKKYIIPKVDPKPLGLSKEKSVALSAFYYRGSAAKLIVGDSGKTTLLKLEKKMQEECAIADKRVKDPKMYHPEFLCMDLIYIHLLLKEGYGLKDQNTLEMIIKLDNHELSWALGFAYSRLAEEYKLNGNTKENKKKDQKPAHKKHKKIK